MEKGNFIAAGDGVDPAKVPHKTLYTGARIPAIGLGTLATIATPQKRLLRQ